MSEHLSPEEISRWMARDCAPEAARHGEECAECRAAIARVESALAAFRGSVDDWSLAQSGGPVARGWDRARPQPWRWALAATFLAAVAIQLHRGAPPRAEMSKADVQLLEQVNAGVSRAVPRPMEPLMKLVSWDAGPAAESEKQR